VVNFLKYKKIYYIFSLTLAIVSLAVLLTFGLNLGIDFTGGSILELDFETRAEHPAIQAKLKDLNLGEVIIQPTGEKGVILRFQDVDENTHQTILAQLNELSQASERRFESVGSVIGRELKQKTIMLVIVSLAALLFYIALAFRKVSRPVQSWQYGIVSIIALFFDVLIPLGVFSFLGRFYGIQFTIPMVTALLTILGYTINDKVIIFDRVRENLLKSHQEHFEDLINQSLNQILLRSLSTGTCTLLVLFSIFFFGGETLKYFALTLIIGIVVGTYSSIFLAAPFLTRFSKNA